MKIFLSVSLLVGLLGSGGSLACQFDLDCSRGGKCVKDWNATYGVCYGGARPGNEGDRRPGPQPGDSNHTGGNTCSLDAECGPGSACLKQPGARDGVCYGSQG